MRPDKMALWNEFLPSIEEKVKPITTCHIPTTGHKSSTSSKPDDKKGTAMKRKLNIHNLSLCLFVFFVRLWFCLRGSFYQIFARVFGGFVVVFLLVLFVALVFVSLVLRFVRLLLLFSGFFFFFFSCI